MELNVNNAGKSKFSANEAMATPDRFHKDGGDSYFSAYKFQNVSCGDSGRLPQPFITDYSWQEEPPLPYNSWPVQEDPFQLMNCTQGIPKNRILTDGNDCVSEMDLYGLVSNILEEVDPTDCYFSQEKSSCLQSAWSPKSTEDCSLQYLNFEVKMQSRPGMQSNHLCHEPTGGNSNQNTDIYQDFNSFDVADQSWLFSACNGESEAHSPGVQDFIRPPPGLSIPSAINTHIPNSRIDKSEPDIPVSGTDSSLCSTKDVLCKNMNALNNSCCSPNEMKDPYFSPSQDLSLLNRHKSQRNPVAMLDTDKLACRVQDDKMFDLKRHPFQMSALVAKIPSLKKDIIGCLGEQREGDFGKNQLSHSDYNTMEFSRFGQLSDYFEPPKSYSSPINSSTMNQSKDIRQRETRPLETSLYQHNHSQHQSQTKLPAMASINSHQQDISELMSHSVAEFVPFMSSQQRPKDKATDFGQGNGTSLQERMGQTGFGLGLESLRNIAGSGDGGNFSMQPGSNRLRATPATGFTSDGPKSQQFGVIPKPLVSFPREVDKSQGLVLNPYQFQGPVYAGQARCNVAGPSQAKPVPSQLFPYMYKMGDPRKNLGHLFTSHSLLPIGNSVSLMEMNDLLPDGEFPTLNPYLQGLIGPNTAGVEIPGFLPTTRSPKFNKGHEAPMSQLHQYLEECYEQWRMLEKERKKAESVLVKSYPRKHVSVVSCTSLPKMPLNPSRVDRLIVDQLREQAKVVSLLGRMECLRSFPLHANICSALDRHLDTIHVTQACRKDTFLNSSRQRQGSAYLREDRETLLLASALKNLSSSTRKSRSALWCALQMTLPRSKASPVEGGEEDRHSPDIFIPERAVHTL